MDDADEQHQQQQQQQQAAEALQRTLVGLAPFIMQSPPLQAYQPLMMDAAAAAAAAGTPSSLGHATH